MQRQLPLQLKLDASFAESVFGRHLPLTHSSSWQISVAGQKLAISIDPELKKIFDRERDSLRLADWPQAAKIDRAWVYLDRGRAWGLKMSDRMVAKVGGEMVKGHVVRFFGPEAKLQSPRGFPIREGAILYIRKGQQRTKPGLEFRMDPRQFPTSYPIAKDAP